MLDSYIERLTPHFLTVGRECRAYGERIVSHLEAVERAIRDQEFEETRETSRGFFATASGGNQRFDSVPQGVDWELEVITAGQATTIASLSDGIGTIFIVNAGLGGPTKGGEGLIVKGGTDLLITVNEDANVYAQWKVKRPARGRTKGYIGGIAQPIPDGNYDVPAEGRHDGGNSLAALARPGSLQ